MTRDKKVLLSHAGKQHAYHVARSLNFLYEFHTTSYVTDSKIQAFLKNIGDKFFSKRFLPGLSGNKIKTNWHLEFPEIFYSKLGFDRKIIQNAVYSRDVKFDKKVSNALVKKNPNIFWGFQGSCLESLKMANKKGIHSVCELSTGHVTESIKILSEERKLHPQWADSFDNLEFPPAYLDRLVQEPHEAKTVIAASSFTKDTLIKDGVGTDKIKVLPLGFDDRFLKFDQAPLDQRKDGKLKLLYAGRITQRKGIHYLLEAMKELTDIATLDIIGFIHGSGKGLKNFEKYYNLYPPLSQQDLYQKYEEYDALILPSLFEGFGLVIVEAMAKGLPVITTRNTIGRDIIKNGNNGYLVNIREADGIVKAVSDLYKKSKEERHQMKFNARKTVEDLSWSNYKDKLKKLINDLEA